MNQNLKLKLNRSIVGKWATIKWDDTGRQDCVITDILDDGKINRNTSIRVYSPYDNSSVRISAFQIIEVRGYLKAN